MKHNAEQEGIRDEYERQRNGGTTTTNGYALNEFARMEQGREQLQKNQ